jgi:putative hydrolase of the HAD superfamily
MNIRAVVFDLGGVVLDSPLAAIAEFEHRIGLPAGTVNAHVAATGGDGAWARHERGEIRRSEFLVAFRREFESRGIGVDTDALMDDIDRSIRVRPAVLDLVDRVRRRGVAAAALTNNWRPFGPVGLAEHFDVMVESVVEGTRKPEPRIYRICLERLGVEASECIMLDDLGPNLKPARAMGMRTVKVTSEQHAKAEVEGILALLK